MRDAAVGFQCPECVAEGARSIPAPRTSYGGLHRGNPQLTSFVLMGLNLAVWLLIVATGGSASAWVSRLGIKLGSYCISEPRLPEGLCRQIPGGWWSNGVDGGAWWQLVTATFTHVEIMHIAFNMFALFILGPQLEALMGRARFLATYLIAGLGGSVAVLWLENPYGLTVGASGSIFGLMAALLVVVHQRGGNPQHIVMWVGINLVITFTSNGISWQGHLGGFLVGGLIAAIVAYAPRGAGTSGPASRARLQYAGMAAITVALLALAALRVTMW